MVGYMTDRVMMGGFVIWKIWDDGTQIDLSNKKLKADSIELSCSKVTPDLQVVKLHQPLDMVRTVPLLWWIYQGWGETKISLKGSMTGPEDEDLAQAINGLFVKGKL